PPLIYYKGMIEQLSGPTIAIVGTRRMSSYGKLMTEKIARELVENQICIVSGLAVGVDAIAHITSLNFNGITAAVLGSGLSSYNIYPSINRKLAHNILEKNGVLISEYPPEMLPLKHNFPLRNRIIAGLSLATIVVEAGESSGALITAKYALEFNREIFAVPGNANSLTSAGPNNLIKQGANLITSAEDIFLNLNLQYTTNRREKISADSPIQQIILDQLSFEPIHINNLQKQTNLSAAELNASLTIMELQGKVRNLGNMHYTKNI
ncbi:DNA protecting protein DprA, partial [Candidatus Falkowbacteria bacterium RIFOXYD2_FULL_35_9]